MELFEGKYNIGEAVQSITPETLWLVIERTDICERPTMNSNKNRNALTDIKNNFSVLGFRYDAQFELYFEKSTKYFSNPNS